MTTCALVVGCNEYPQLPGATAPGPLADAAAFRHWLLTNGAVHPGDLRFLASGADHEPRMTRVVADGTATYSNFSSEVETFVTTRSGERLYVYFAGHSAHTDPDHPYFSQDALVLADFDPAAPAAACVAVRELITQLAQSDFREVVVIVDAARRFPFDEPINLMGFGTGWIGKRRSGAVVQFLIQAAPMSSGSLTAALLDGLAGKTAPGASGQADSPVVVRWSSLVQYLRFALPRQPPITSGHDTSLVLARPSGPQLDGGASDGQAAAGLAQATEGWDAGSTVDIESVDSGTEDGGGTTGGTPVSRRMVAVSQDDGAGLLGEFEIRSTDPNAMLTIESLSGDRLAVGVGSIEGRLPTGSYVAVLVDPGGVDPRVQFDLELDDSSAVELDPNERSDGFRVTDDPALRWSSASAQLAAATASIWSNGHRSFVVLGWNGTLAAGTSTERKRRDWADNVDPVSAEFGELPLPDGGWWIAIPMSRPWCTIRVGSHRITVPVAPDSVSAIAITSTETTVALFDTTHPAPVHIASQDRVQQYLGLGRLGAADLTSRLTIEADRRWPWGATAAVRRLIDGARRARDEGAGPPNDSESAPGVLPPPGIDLTGDPPHQFVAQVPAGQRHRLIGRGPWAAWLDWPDLRAAGPVPER